jgi:hypothetical protein
MFTVWTGRPFQKGVPLEEATSEALPHLLGKSLEGTLSSVPRGSKARDPHLMMGSGASHLGSCNYHKKSQAILTIEKHKLSLLNDSGTTISAIPFSPDRFPKKITIGAYQASL